MLRSLGCVGWMSTNFYGVVVLVLRISTWLIWPYYVSGIRGFSLELLECVGIFFQLYMTLM